MDLEVRHLRMIVVVAESGSVTKAAASLGLAQPALTAQLNRIDRALGGCVFTRDRQGARPTELGELVLRHARDAEDADGDDGPARASSRPHGLAYLDHLVATVARNVARPGITQLYAVLSAESVTDGHPAQQWFRDRYVGLRALVERALEEALERGEVPVGTDVEQTAAAIVAVMDGLQVQWLLDPDRVDMVAVTRRTIDALVAALGAAPAGRP